ncbi:MAG: carbonic anhydrase [Planctomycetes bacterium]|nr:carbonic anhydrase [Planctomycetota bacterium]
MEKLIRGIVEFREHLLPEYVERFGKLASRQTPDALFISCSDSRVVPDLVASTDPGDLFVTRNVGNLVPPATYEGHSTGDVSEASAIEFAVLVLKVSSIVVCGHSECGAMKATLAGVSADETPNLERWLHHSTSAAMRLANEGPLDPTIELHDQLSQLNVLVQLENLGTYPLVRERMQTGNLRLFGCWFNIATGEMLAYRRETRRFEPIDRDHAERMIAALHSKA